MKKLLAANRASAARPQSEVGGGGGGDGEGADGCDYHDDDLESGNTTNQIPLQPTVVVQPTSDLGAIARTILQTFEFELGPDIGSGEPPEDMTATEKLRRERDSRQSRVVLKENFSAGKEGVTFLRLVKTPDDPDGSAQLVKDLEAHRFVFNARTVCSRSWFGGGSFPYTLDQGTTVIAMHAVWC